MTGAYSSRTQKGEQSLSFLHCGYLLVGDSTVLCDLPIGAVGDILTCRRIPTGTLGNRLPSGNTACIGNTGKVGAFIERIVTNSGHAVRDGDTGKAIAAFERATTNSGHAVRDGYACKTGAVIERIVINSGHAVRDRDTGKVGAAFERTTTNTGHAVWDGDARKAGAASKRIIINASHTVWDGISSANCSGHAK